MKLAHLFEAEIKPHLPVRRFMTKLGKEANEKAELVNFRHDKTHNTLLIDRMYLCDIAKKLNPGHGDLFKEEDCEMLVDELNKLLKPFKWHVNALSHQWHWAILAPDQIDSDLVKDLPATLYHFSPIENKEGIEKDGLIPKKGNHGGNFRYPERIFVSSSAEKMKEGAIKIFKIRKITKFVAFEINTKKLPQGVEFYRDRAYWDVGLWTSSPIPVNALKFHSEFSVDD